MAKLNTTTSGIITATLTADSSPTLELQENGVTIGKFGNQPAFSAYNSNTQTFSGGVYTKIVFNTEEFDTNNNFDNTTNYRFTPTIAGYYQVSGGLSANTQLGYFTVAIYKNGSSYKRGANYALSATYSPNAAVSGLVYLNGTTDYVELYGIANAGFTTFAGIDTVYFQAVLVRAA